MHGFREGLLAAHDIQASYRPSIDVARRETHMNNDTRETHMNNDTSAAATSSLKGQAATSIGRRALLVSGAAAGITCVVTHTVPIAPKSCMAIMELFVPTTRYTSVTSEVFRSHSSPDTVLIGDVRDPSAVRRYMQSLEDNYEPQWHLESFHGADVPRFLTANPLAAPRAFAGMFRLMDRFMASMGIQQADALELSLQSLDAPQPQLADIERPVQVLRPYLDMKS